MKLNFVFLAFLLVSSALAQDYTKQAACIRDTLGKLSQAGKIHAFGIRVTNESSITVDSFTVGGTYSKLTSKLVAGEQNKTLDPTLNPVETIINSTNRTYSYVDLLVIEKDPIQKVIDGVSKAQLLQLEKTLEQESQDQKEKEVGGNKITAKTEEGQATKDELINSITDVDVSIKKLENKGLTINTKSETATAQMKELLQPTGTSTTDISQETKDQIVIINGQRLIKKMSAQTSVLEEKIKEESTGLQTLEDKLKIVTDAKEVETIKNEIKKIQIQIEKLEEKKATITSTIRVVNQTVSTANQTITTIKQEIEKANLEEIKKFGNKCTSYSIRPSVKFCVKWRTTEDAKVCDQWKDIYRGSKCLKHDAAGKCVDTEYFFDEKVQRYECESHSLDFPKEHCLQWESKNGQAVCIKNETFYQAQTCVEFVLVGKELKCGQYQGAYPAFRCVKTMLVDGKEVCKEMGAYTPHYYCKEYMMVDGHRYCKKRELFFGTHTVQFECEEKEKLKDANTGEVHCMKFTAKKLEQFKDFQVQPISEKTITIIEKATKQVETEVKKIEKKIVSEAAEVKRIEKKIKELEKNMGKMTTTTEVTTIKKIIEAERKKAETIKHQIEVEKDIKDKIKSAETTVERRKVQIQGEIRDSRGRIITEAEEVKRCTRTITEAKDKLKYEKDPATIEKIKRIITEESDKKKQCQITITTIKQDIHEKEKQIKETKVDIKTIEAKIKESEIKELIKKQTEELKDKKKQIEIIRDTIKKTTDLSQRDALVKKYTTITEQIKIIKHDIKHEKKDIKNLITQEIVTIKKKTETTIEDFKKRLRTIETTITELEEMKKRITTEEEKIKIIEIIKKKTEESSEIRKKLIEIEHESKITIIKLIEEEHPKTDIYVPKRIPTTNTTIPSDPIPPIIDPVPVPPKNETVKPTDPHKPEITIIEDPPAHNETTCIKRTTIDVPIPVDIDFDTNQTSIKIDGNNTIKIGDQIKINIDQKTTCLEDESKKVIIEDNHRKTTEDDKTTITEEEEKTRHNETHRNETQTIITTRNETQTIITTKNETRTEENRTHHDNSSKVVIIRNDTSTTTDEEEPPRRDESTCIKNSTYTSEVEIPVELEDDISKHIEVTVTNKTTCVTEGERVPSGSSSSSSQTTHTEVIRKDTTNTQTDTVRPPAQSESTCIKTTTIDVPVPEKFRIDTKETKIVIEGNGKKTTTDGKIVIEVDNKKTHTSTEERRNTETRTETERRRDTERRTDTERRRETETRRTETERRRDTETRRTETETRRDTQPSNTPRQPSEPRQPTEPRRPTEPRQPETPTRRRRRTETTCIKTSTVDVPIEGDFDFDSNQSSITIEGNGKSSTRDGKIQVEVDSKKSCYTNRHRKSRKSTKTVRTERTVVRQSTQPVQPRNYRNERPAHVVIKRETIVRRHESTSRPTKVVIRSDSSIRTPVQTERRTKRRYIRRGQVCTKESKVDIPIYEDVDIRQGGSYTITPGHKKYFKRSGLEAEVFEQKKCASKRIQKLRTQKDIKLRTLHRTKEVKINKLTIEHITSRINRLIEREQREVSKLKNTGRSIKRESRNIRTYRRLLSKFQSFKCTEDSCFKNTHFLNQVERRVKKLERASSISSAQSQRGRRSLERLCNRHFYRLSGQRRHPVHIRRASAQYGRGLQSVSPTTADVSLVKTFQEHITTFRPADRALINGCFA